MSSVPFTDTTLGLCRFSVSGPRLWNELSLDIRQCNTLPAFKSRLKTFHMDKLTMAPLIALDDEYARAE